MPLFFVFSTIIKILFPLCLVYVLRVKDQGRTKEQPKNSQTQKVLFIKIAVSFISLIPCLVFTERTPREHRESSDPTPRLQKVLFVKITFLKRLTNFLKKLTLFLKPLIYLFLRKNYLKSVFSCTSRKKSVSLRPNIQKN